MNREDSGSGRQVRWCRAKFYGSANGDRDNGKSRGGLRPRPYFSMQSRKGGKDAKVRESGFLFASFASFAPLRQRARDMVPLTALVLGHISWLAIVLHPPTLRLSISDRRHRLIYTPHKKRETTLP